MKNLKNGEDEKLDFNMACDEIESVLNIVGRDLDSMGESFKSLTSGSTVERSVVDKIVHEYSFVVDAYQDMWDNVNKLALVSLIHKAASNPKLLESVPNELKCSKRFWESVIELNPLAYKHLPKEFQKDKELQKFIQDMKPQIQEAKKDRIKTFFTGKTESEAFPEILMDQMTDTVKYVMAGADCLENGEDDKAIGIFDGVNIRLAQTLVDVVDDKKRKKVYSKLIEDYNPFSDKGAMGDE